MNAPLRIPHIRLEGLTLVMIESRLRTWLKGRTSCVCWETENLNANKDSLFKSYNMKIYKYELRYQWKSNLTEVWHHYNIEIALWKYVL